MNKGDCQVNRNEFKCQPEQIWEYGKMANRPRNNMYKISAAQLKSASRNEHQGSESRQRLKSNVGDDITQEGSDEIDSIHPLEYPRLTRGLQA